jgi:2-dehydropantoate 2-reductase
MRVVLFGTGAMSCLFAARLSAVAQVFLIGSWKDAISAIQSRGILVEDASQPQTIRVQAEVLGKQLEPGDLGIVLVKSWQTERVAPFLPAYLRSGAPAISLQNGLGNLEKLGNHACAGSTNVGATLLGPGKVRAGGNGSTHVAAPEWVVQFFRSAGFECFGCSPIQAESLIWGKLAVSCGINALTALLRVANGRLLEIPPARDLMDGAATECASVAAARGIQLPFPDAVAKVREVAEQTAGNHSSMLQDVLRGAPTECDAINGTLAGEGRRLGIPTPINDVLWRAVRAIVFNNRSPIDHADHG